jgi:hypothetical protein
MAVLGDSGVWGRTLKQAAVLLVLILIAAFVGGTYGASLWRLATRTPEPLLAACEAIGGEPLRATLTGWAQSTAASDIPLGELQAIPREALAILVSSDAAAAAAGEPVETITGPASGLGFDEGVEYTLASAETAYRAYVRQVKTQSTLSLFLVCSVNLGQPVALEPLRSRLEESLHTLGKGGERPEPVYVTLHCRVPGVLTSAESEQLCKKVFSRLFARKVNELEGGTWYTVMSHTPFLRPAIAVAGRQVNLSLVFRPDEQAGCTWVIFGSPLCAGDY